MDMTRIDARKMQMTERLIMKNSVTVGVVLQGRPGSTPLPGTFREHSKLAVNNRICQHRIGRSPVVHVNRPA